MDKYVGKRLDGRYEIQEIIGNGGMANVYKAYDKLEDQFVALKILKDEYSDNEEFLRRFRNESKAISVLSHSNIVRIIDVSFGNNIQYIVMEYIDGITLKQYMEQAKVLTWKEAVHFSLQILKALQHAHENGVVHRDIKPENIMLQEDGTIKVTDFGIASFARDESRMKSSTAIGSVHYISPEQATGASADERTDVYSVGVMLYEMLTGTLPFDGVNAEQIAVMHMQAKAKAPRTINDTIPEGLEEIVIRAMQKNPSMRYQTASEMIRDIDDFKRNPSILFEYKYFSDEGTTKFFNAVNAGKNMAYNGDENGNNQELSEEDIDKKKNSKTMVILAAVAAACVVLTIIAVVFVFALSPKTADIVMPDLVGLDYQEVVNDSQYSQIKLNPIQEYSEDEEAGVILEQSVPKGRVIKEGSVVEVTVSSGAKLVDVPDVYGFEQVDAEAVMTEKGINFTVVKAYDLSVASGSVIKTVPARNEQIPSNETVTIHVSMGKPTDKTVVPNVIGMTQSNATKELEKVGLNVKVSKVNSTETAGKVIDQSSAEGTSVNEGTTITISVSTGKASAEEVSFSVSIPDSATGDYTFKVYLDGTQKQSNIINVDSVDKFSFTLKSSSISSQVSVLVSKSGSTEQKLFVKYDVNFLTGKQNIVSGPDNSVFAAPAVSSAPATVVSSSPAAEVSSEETSVEEPITE